MGTHKKLIQARRKRGWSLYEAARRAAIGHQQIVNLEDGVSEPGDVKARTLFALVRLYWPDVKLSDLCPGEDLELVPASRDALLRMLVGEEAEV